MCKTILISIIININLYFVNSNSLKSMLERNNIVNKGLWIRNKAGNKNPGDFIFRANSLDADSVLQNNFDAFGDNNVQNSPFLTSYVERNKRSLSKTKHSEETNNRCKNKSQCLNSEEQTASMVKSKFISTLKPGSVFIDYPFAVAAIINDNDKNEVNVPKQHNTVIKEDFDKVANLLPTGLIETNKESLLKDAADTIIAIPTTTTYMKRDVNDTQIIPRRKHNYETDIINDIEFKEFNKSEIDKKDIFRNVFDKEDIVWQNSAPISNTNVYKVIPKSRENIKNKPITERGLIKVLSMLTKTFKKIMKQHNDIKRIHNRLYNLNDDFVKNVEKLTKKFEDFNSKYSRMVKIDQELKQVEAKLKDKEQNFLAKEKEMAKNMMAFENQQRKFLAQQRQFYNVQKLLLAQNEKINSKQDLIAKTQSEISHRQNNFARILKKAKQIYIDAKNFPNKLNPGITKSKTNSVKEKSQSETDIIASIPTTESVKINLFSIPTTSGIKNQDQILLNEKEDQPIDDLIYKYYFNNTFIDEIMKNKILSTLLANENTENTKKNKRDELKLKATLLLPVTKSYKDISIHNKNRIRRWIKHSKKNVHKKDKSTTSIPKTNIKENIVNAGNKVPKGFGKVDLKNGKGDPFMTMALNFCKEIGQDTNIQSLNWCVEKALRRLKVIDFNMASILPLKPSKESKTKNDLQNNTPIQPPTLETSSTVKLEPTSPVTTEAHSAFFPDNDELETKLKEYEMKPDTEGTVYYEGSFHSSDLGRIVKADSEGFSDIMPGLDSDSRVQVDPLALDLQAQRRIDVRKINERIRKMRLG